MPNGGMHSYRMTEEEFERFVGENDPLCPEFLASVTRRQVKLAQANPNAKINLGYGSVTYDAGFYWIRTSQTVDWM